MYRLLQYVQSSKFVELGFRHKTVEFVIDWCSVKHLQELDLINFKNIVNGDECKKQIKYLLTQEIAAFDQYNSLNWLSAKTFFFLHE